MLPERDEARGSRQAAVEYTSCTAYIAVAQ